MFACRREYRWWRCGHHWQHAAASLALLWTIAIGFIGCKTDPDIPYAIASQELNEGKYSCALEIVNKLLGSGLAKDPLWLYKVRALKARIVVNNDPKQALELLELEPPPQLIATEIPAFRALTQGKAYYYGGDNLHGQEKLNDAKKLASSNSPQLLPKIAFTQGFFSEKEHIDLAEENYREALDLARQYKDKPTETDSLINLGHILMRREQYDQAIDELLLALQQARAGKPDLWSEEVALGDLGWSYYQLGQFDQAASYLHDAYITAVKAGRKDDQQKWSLNLGALALREGNYSQSEGYYQQSLMLAISNKASDWMAISWLGLAQLELRRDNVQKAEDYNRQSLAAAKIIPDPDLNSRRILTAAEIAVQHRQFSAAEQLLLSVRGDTRNSSSIARKVDSDLAAIYIAENKPVDAEREFQAAIRDIEEARDKVKTEEQRMSMTDGWNFYDDYIRFLMQKNNASKALQIAEFSRARTLAEGLKIAGPKEPAQVSVQKIQDSLKGQNQFVLAYWLAEKESYLWVIAPGWVQHFVLPPENEIAPEIQAYTRKLQNHQEDYAEGEKLFASLVGPAANLIPKGSEITIIPNGSLYQLSFETLVVPGPKPHYWIEDVTVKIGVSIAVLAQSDHDQVKHAAKLLLIGAPQLASSEFPLLPNADDEIQRIASYFPKGQKKIIDHAAAIPSAYKLSQPSQFTLIHFVTHGTAVQKIPLDSAIILSLEAPDTYKLYVRDIMEIPIHAKLVIISACYGLGTRAYSAEGLVGLAWGFLRAGAQQVIASLWEVDDRITPDFMDHLYGGLKNKSAAAALRAAKLDMLHSDGPGRLPYYWASLQLYVARDD